MQMLGVVERDIALETVYPCTLQISKVTSQDQSIDAKSDAAKSRGFVVRKNTTRKHTCEESSLKMM